VKDIVGLPLYVGDVHTNDRAAFAGCMRNAVNYPIQCSSQSILKLAMTSIYKKYNLIPVLMVHDEVVYELPDEKVNQLSELILAEMVNAYEMKAPLKVSHKISKHWEK
jgi:DNA polymerase-1